MNLFRSWILRWFVPDELQTDADSQRQAVRAILFGFAMLVWWPVFTPLYVWLGSTLDIGHWTSNFECVEGTLNIQHRTSNIE